MFLRVSSSSLGLSIVATHCLLMGFIPSVDARGREKPVFATSADDAVLRRRLVVLSSNVRPEEAQRVAQCAYTTGRELKRDWKVVWPPGLHNFLVNTGARKGGLCFQWATELLLRLDALKLETLDLHWAESFERTASEHNVIVVTARGQPFQQGILLDNWRYGGRLIWGPVTGDPDYQWKENKAEAVHRLRKKGAEAAGPGTRSNRVAAPLSEKD